jgi:hypothetical protein
MFEVRAEYEPEIRRTSNGKRDRAVTQAGSRRLPNAAAQIRAQAVCGCCSGQSGIG